MQKILIFLFSLQTNLDTKETKDDTTNVSEVDVEGNIRTTKKSVSEFELWTRSGILCHMIYRYEILSNGILYDFLSYRNIM